VKRIGPLSIPCIIGVVSKVIVSPFLLPVKEGRKRRREKKEGKFIHPRRREGKEGGRERITTFFFRYTFHENPALRLT